MSRVDAVAAKPHRDGASQDSWSSPALPLRGRIPPERMTWAMASRTSSGMAFSDVLTSEDTSSPSAMEASASTTTASATSGNGAEPQQRAVGGHRAAGEAQHHEQQRLQAR